jgi:hypothetical protein
VGRTVGILDGSGVGTTVGIALGLKVGSGVGLKTAHISAKLTTISSRKLSVTTY